MSPVSGKKTNFKSLIQLAVDNGWIKDDGFVIASLRKDVTKSYVETLVDVMPKLRNQLAHGSGMLHNSGLSSLRICADFINHLFDGKK